MYKDLTPDQIEKVFAEDVLGWEYDEAPRGYNSHWNKPDGDTVMDDPDFWSPLTRLDDCMLGVEKVVENGWLFTLSYEPTVPWEAYFEDFDNRIVGQGDTPQEAIVEACIRIKRPDLFERGL